MRQESKANLCTTIAAQSSSCLLLITVNTLSELPSLLHSCSPLHWAPPNTGYLVSEDGPKCMEWKDKFPINSLFWWIKINRKMDVSSDLRFSGIISLCSFLSVGKVASWFEKCNSYYRCCLWRSVSTPIHTHGLSIPPKNPTWNASITSGLLLLHHRQLWTLPCRCAKTIPNHETCAGKRHYAWFSLRLFPLGANPWYDNTRGMSLNFISSSLKQLFSPGLACDDIQIINSRSKAKCKPRQITQPAREMRGVILKALRQ